MNGNKHANEHVNEPCTHKQKRRTRGRNQQNENVNEHKRSNEHVNNNPTKHVNDITQEHINENEHARDIHHEVEHGIGIELDIEGNTDTEQIVGYLNFGARGQSVVYLKSSPEDPKYRCVVRTVHVKDGHYIKLARAIGIL